LTDSLPRGCVIRGWPNLYQSAGLETRWENAGRKQSEVDEDYRQAAHLAALVAPNRHLTGLELLPKAKAARPDVPIIMITAYGDTETKQKKLEGGAEALLPKPIDFVNAP
jgi:DNA-binding response OmpR family regulator